MARRIHLEPSRTLTEFRLLPGLTTRETSIEQVSLESPLVLRPNGGAISLTTPVLAAAMQSVTGSRMGIELARLGAAAVIYCSQSVADEAAAATLAAAHIELVGTGVLICVPVPAADELPLPAAVAAITRATAEAEAAGVPVIPRPGAWLRGRRPGRC